MACDADLGEYGESGKTSLNAIRWNDSQLVSPLHWQQCNQLSSLRSLWPHNIREASYPSKNTVTSVNEVLIALHLNCRHHMTGCWIVWWCEEAMLEVGRSGADMMDVRRSQLLLRGYYF